MSLFELLSFAGAMLILVVIPGPGVFAVVARAMASGFSHASVVVVGIVFGDLVFLFVALFGLSFIAEWLGDVFVAIKYLGAAYLVFLGVKLISSIPDAIKLSGVPENAWKQNILSGLVITFGNPKVILFYMSILPNLIDMNKVSSFDIVCLSSIITLVLGGTMLGYAYGAAKARKLFESENSQQRLNRIAGGIMILTGLVLGVKS